MSSTHCCQPLNCGLRPDQSTFRLNSPSGFITNCSCIHGEGEKTTAIITNNNIGKYFNKLLQNNIVIKQQTLLTEQS